MNKSYFLQLMHKYLQGKASAEERNFLISYYALFESEADVVALMSKDQKEELENALQAGIWEGIDKYQHLQQHRKQTYKRLKRTLLIAASVIAAISTGYVVFTMSKTDRKTAVTQSNVQKVLRLIHTPDGSTVILSAGSKINYPSSFDDLASREVYLEGQAYFDIKHNAAKPFIVHTEKLKITVLGTAFNVNALPANADIEVTVTRGRVKMADENSVLGIITPNQQITYHKKDADIVKRSVDAGKYLGWKEEDMQLENVTVEEATRLMEEKFTVSIRCESEQIRLKRFTTVFLKDEGLEEILKSICEFNDAVYQYDKKTAAVIISSKSATAN